MNLNANNAERRELLDREEEIFVRERLLIDQERNTVTREKDLYSMPESKIIEIDTTIESLSKFAKQQGTNYKLLKQLNHWLFG